MHFYEREGRKFPVSSHFKWLLLLCFIYLFIYLLRSLISFFY